jgi:hypothetical protein
MKEGIMTLSSYYAALLRRNDEMAPTLEEAQQDFQRVVDLNQAALAAFGGY